MKSEKIYEKQVKIVRVNPDNIRSIFANDLVVNHGKNEFFLTFSEIEPPVILEERDLEQIKEIKAEARVRLVVSPQFAEAIVKALSTNIQKYKSTIEKKASE